MKKEYIFIIAIVLVILLYTKNGNMEKSIGSFETLGKKLAERIGKDKASFAMAQILHETGGKIKGLAVYHNYSGIVFIGQKGAFDTHIKQPDGKYNYAGYKTIEDYIEDYLRIVGKSIKQSDTLSAYASYLKAQRYYGDTTANYLNGMSRFFNKAKSYTNVA